MKTKLSSFILGAAIAAGFMLAACGRNPSSDPMDRAVASEEETERKTDEPSESKTETESDAKIDLESIIVRKPADTFCTKELQGICAPNGKGCASCPRGFLVYPASAGCTDGAWCCVQYRPATNSCEKGGGVCVSLDYECPDGWVSGGGGCVEDFLGCCIPEDKCD